MESALLLVCLMVFTHQFDCKMYSKGVLSNECWLPYRRTNGIKQKKKQKKNKNKNKKKQKKISKQD